MTHIASQPICTRLLLDGFDRSVAPAMTDMSSRPLKEETPTVLIVGLPDSVHTARWMKMLQGRGVRFVLVPVYASAISKEFGNVLFVRDSEDLAKAPDDHVCVFDINSVDEQTVVTMDNLVNYQPWRPAWLSKVRFTRPEHLLCAIRRFRPSLVHSLIVQFGGYLCLSCKEHVDKDFPPWLASNWGSDICLFRMLSDHQPRIMKMISMIDAYHAECQRDILMVKQMGFSGFTFPALPASGGMNFDEIPKFATFSRPSERREILIKGYHGWSGRALHTLSALHLTVDALRGYTLRITLADRAVEQMASALVKRDGLNIVIEPYLDNHRDALMRMANARLVIGLGISDGISTTLLEAMTVGAFPIQGTSSCGNEWLIPNETGIFVSPHDIDGLAKAIRRAVTVDEMVDAAASRNRKVVEARWNASSNGTVAVHNYRLLIDNFSARP